MKLSLSNRFYLSSRLWRLFYTTDINIQLYFSFSTLFKKNYLNAASTFWPLKWYKNRNIPVKLYNMAIYLKSFAFPVRQNLSTLNENKPGSFIFSGFIELIQISLPFRKNRNNNPKSANSIWCCYGNRVNWKNSDVKKSKRPQMFATIDVIGRCN